MLGQILNAAGHCSVGRAIDCRGKVVGSIVGAGPILTQ